MKGLRSKEGRCEDMKTPLLLTLLCSLFLLGPEDVCREVAVAVAVAARVNKARNGYLY